ncbi:conjugative transposon protein TraM [Pedobacter sp. N36a]|uniref:conjugative transposon protein TraM n=1 Tax=Pedobacter sp. N36a TaxID=2767996 RepID=UPI0016570767|nr:conjugative transposon protein TraM [Pedobacter sp. N36a]MBC8986663.1 conjugative transposon protein TraM [Pedobacter sp. N36a]
MMTKRSKDKRKVLLFLPLLVLPFLALAFYAMGGGRNNKEKDQQLAAKGINTNLPDASFKKTEPVDKMGYYAQLDRDNSLSDSNGLGVMTHRLGFGEVKHEDPAEQINLKLEALNRELEKPAKLAAEQGKPAGGTSQATSIKNDVDRLEGLMRTMQENKAEDPEMQQLNGMLQSILDIQHPELVQQRYKEKLVASPDSLFRAIPAEIVDQQKAVQGATIKLRILDSITLNHQKIAKGHFIFGTCRIINQRLLLDIKNIRVGTSIIPVDLSVYALDGMPGMYAPEAMVTESLNGGIDNAARGMGLSGFDQSLPKQVAGAGLDAAKSLLSKKIRRIKVKLKAGERVLLKNNKPEK